MEEINANKLNIYSLSNNKIKNVSEYTRELLEDLSRIDYSRTTEYKNIQLREHMEYFTKNVRIPTIKLNYKIY